MKANKLWGVLALSLLAPGAAAAQEPSEGTKDTGTDTATPAEPPAPAAGPELTSSPNPQGFPEIDEHEVAAPEGEGYLSRLPIDLSGYFWNDTGFLGRINGADSVPNQDANYMQGRYVLQAAYERPIFTAGFVKAQVQLLGLVNEFSQSQYEPHTLDAYLQFGQRGLWDVQVGRFLAWQVYQRGQGIELYTAEEAGAQGGPQLYWLQTTRGHRNEAGQGAVHFYPARWAGFELASVYGQEGGQNNLGVRPAAYVRLGGLMLVAGAEYQRQKPQTIDAMVSSTTKGYAARVEYRLLPVTVGMGYAQAHNEATDIEGNIDSAKSGTTRTVGSYADVDVGPTSLGLGFHRTMQDNERGELNTHNQAFVSLKYNLPVKGLSAKVVGGYARARLEDLGASTNITNSMRSVRVRLRYDFR